MKNMLFAITLFASFAASASPSPTRHYTGRVSKMILAAMKSAGVKPVCEKNVCTHTVTDFYTATETDGCSGGIPSADTSFTYADGKSYSYHFCDMGEASQVVPADKGDALAGILYELGYYGGAGWVAFTEAKKIECTTYKNNPSIGADCEVTERVRGK